MNHARCRLALVVWALASSALLLACGGKSDGSLNEPTEAEACTVSPCPSGLGWDSVTCACDLIVDAGLPVEVDATLECPLILCPAGSVSGIEDGECACVPIDSGVPFDASSFEDVSYSDSEPPYYPDAPFADAFYPYADAYAPFDAPPSFEDASFPVDGAIYCPPYYCGNGYSLNQFCQCVPCATTCPLGQTPSLGCSECVACSYTCPAGFDYGPGCGCVPHGTDAGSPPVVDAGDGGDGGGGVICTIEGSTQCQAGSWCELGVCPDGKTQYGCYCNADGTATCNVSCPVPPACTIPGEGTCPYGSQCVYGSCVDGQSDSVFVCYCESGGSASCYTSSCADGGPFISDGGGAPGDGGVTCLLEGYTSCNAGSYCSLGTCPDGTTQYGCFCNQDGTATCDLTCPPPPACKIPGEGSCPYETECVYGKCNGNVGTLLSCYCGYGGEANCYTSSCSASDGGSEN
jgi:hypothetical protein